MKNMKKLLQKAMVFTLSAAMLVGTPMTASAAGLVDLYSTSDGTGKVDDGTSEKTGTITNTDTNTGFLIENNKVSIVGIALDRETVNAEVGTQETLKATVVLDGRIYASGDIYNDDKKKVAGVGDDITDKVVAEMSKKIEWKVLYTDADGNIRKDVGNPALKVGLKLTAGSASDRSEVTLTPWEGTKDDEKVTVRATIDASYYFDTDARDKSWSERLESNRKDDKDRDAYYKADATVSVKEYSTELVWKDGNTADIMQLKHTLDLGALLVRKPETANDAITWVSSNPGVAAVSATGVVTAKKLTTGNVKSVKITAVSERGAVAERTITIEQGMKASKVVVQDSWSGNNLEIADKTAKIITAETYARVTVAKDTDNNLMIADAKDKLDASKKGNTVQRNAEVKNGDWYVDADGKVQQMVVTDVITWSSNKTAFATVTPVGDQKGGGTATVSPKGVGKATITAKATNGAKASKVANVVATLESLEIEGVKANQNVYSGQTFQLTAKRNPVQNKDAVKWTVAKADGTGTTKSATINAKGILTIKSQVTDGEKIKVTLAHNKNGTKVTAATVELTVKQSSVDLITVKEGTTEVAHGGFGTDNKKLNKRTGLISETSRINVPLSKTYTASVVNYVDGKEVAGDASTLTWKTSNPKVAALSGSGTKATIKAVAPGTATITVSGVRVNPKNKKASVLSVTYKVQVQQPVTSLTMNKPTVTLAEKVHKTKGVLDQKVALKVTFGPKKAVAAQKKVDSWTIQKPDGTREVIAAKKGAANLTYTLEKAKAGQVYKITAKSITGATATSTITIVKPTTEVAIAQKANADADGIVATIERFKTQNKAGRDVLNTAELTIGVKSSIQMKPVINIGTAEKKGTPTWVTPGTNKSEQVTYTVNKKGIVTVDSQGRVYAVKKGVVTITAKTPTGKKATLKVTVTEPAAK